MDVFFIFNSSFYDCLRKLALVFERYEETNLVLNWKKSHFMVKERIVLDHQILSKEIKVDKAKIKII
jgi:hypothetical protein